MSEELDYESRATPPAAPRSPVRSLAADGALVLNVLSVLAGAYWAVYIYAGITDRGEGEGNWAALGALVIGIFVAPLQLVLMLVSSLLASRDVPGTAAGSRRWAAWTIPAGLAVPALAAAVAFLVVKLR